MAQCLFCALLLTTQCLAPATHFWNDFGISVFTYIYTYTLQKTQHYERLIVHHRCHPGNRMGIRIFLRRFRQPDPHFTGNCNYRVTFGGDKKGLSNVTARVNGRCDILAYKKNAVT